MGVNNVVWRLLKHSESSSKTFVVGMPVTARSVHRRCQSGLDHVNLDVYQSLGVNHLGKIQQEYQI